MVKALFDTNILIDFLNGVPEARRELARYSEKAISVITWMEVLVGAPETLEVPTRAFLEAFTIVPLKDDVAERAVTLRREQRMKLPDAVIWASRRSIPCSSSLATRRIFRRTFPAFGCPTFGSSAPGDGRRLAPPVRQRAAGPIFGCRLALPGGSLHVRGPRNQLKGGDPVSHCQNPWRPGSRIWIPASDGIRAG